MSYIGRQPTVGNFQICDAISVVNGQAAYTMQVGSINVLPETANHMICSLNGTIQKPNSSYTVSGSTITFSSNLATGDVIDFIQILGDVLDLGVPSDATVTTAKLANSAVDLTSKVTGALPVANGGTALTSGFANGITMADQWRLTANNTTNADISSNLERVDDASSAKIGTGMSESSGIFTFPSTGLYLVRYNILGEAIANDNILGSIKTTRDNSSYDEVAVGYFSGDGSSTGSGSSSTECFFNVTNTSTHKVRFNIASIDGGSAVFGNTGENLTFFTFIRLGDSQ